MPAARRARCQLRRLVPLLPRFIHVHAVMALLRRPVNVLVHRPRFFFPAEDGIRDDLVTGVQTCALPIFARALAPWLSTYPIRRIRPRSTTMWMLGAASQL